jgi:hypothetical protein
MFQLPDYTSPPLPEAIEATPAEHRSDEAIDAMRRAAARSACRGNEGGETSDAAEEAEFCQLGFPGRSSTGVILYGGAMVDPRSYSPLARTLQRRYGFTVAVPVFDRDLAWDYRSCSTGRVELARAQFPHVDRWVLAGHSFGAIAASLDLWQLYSSADEESLRGTGVGGMVFMAADPRGDLGCGSLNFSQADLPFSSLTGTRDEVLNFTRYNDNRGNLPPTTFFLEVEGGNHGQYGSSNDTLRGDILNVWDGQATISMQTQQEVAARAIASVAARAGWKPEPRWSQSEFHYNLVIIFLLMSQTKRFFGF